MLTTIFSRLDLILASRANDCFANFSDCLFIFSSALMMINDKKVIINKFLVVLRQKQQNYLKGPLVQILYLLMKNQISLDSPFFRSVPIVHHLTPRRDQEMDSQQAQSRLSFFSPQILHPNFRLLLSSHPKSPFSLFNRANQDEKPNPMISPQNYHKYKYQEEAIEQVIAYSEEQNHDLMTPHNPMCMEQIEFHTTAKKSDHVHSEVKSRPKDKGLRKLSQRAFEAVQELKNATYKEVASHLVSQLNQQDFDGENKEEQNIKRRVYDALNVLIALGVLKKDGRKIVSERDRKGKKLSDRQFQQMNSLKQKIAIKSQILASKQKKLSDVKEKYAAIKYLLERNQSIEQAQYSTINFPFIGIMHKIGETKTEQPSKGELWIRTAEPIQPFGDIDSLKWLRRYCLSSGVKEQSYFFP